MNYILLSDILSELSIIFSHNNYYLAVSLIYFIFLPLLIGYKIDIIIDIIISILVFINKLNLS